MFNGVCFRAETAAKLKGFIMITLLQQYLAINTAHPHPDYDAAVALFKKQALEDGFLVRETTLPSGYPVLVITLHGTSSELPALALNHHMDVVPADNASEWLFPPFAGTVHEGLLYGRGTQDCKGLGVMQYAALQLLKKSGMQPARTIHFIMVPDEERGGYQGTRQFLKDPLFAALNIGYVLDEGMPSGNEHELLLKVDERTPIQIRVTSAGTHSHASGLLHHNCIYALADFLVTVAQFHATQQQMLASESAGNLISMQSSSLSTNNDAVNVIPAFAYATIDMRIPSRVSHAEGIAIIDALVAQHPTISYEILATSQERSAAIPLDSLLYQTLADAVAAHGFTPKPFAFEATTDARFYSHKGIQAIGFTPSTVTPNLHGTNESIRLTDLTHGIKIFYNFLHAFCMNKEMI
jgi:N-acyl-L-amino-acid amidohydrolase